MDTTRLHRRGRDAWPVLGMTLLDAQLWGAPDSPTSDDVQAREWSVFQRAVQPPSMRIVSPVMSEAAGEARNTTTPATSIGSPIRCRAAIRAITSARCAGSA